MLKIFVNGDEFPWQQRVVSGHAFSEKLKEGEVVGVLEPTACVLKHYVPWMLILRGKHFFLLEIN
jgi:hypothetical protein